MRSRFLLAAVVGIAGGAAAAVAGLLAMGLPVMLAGVFAMTFGAASYTVGLERQAKGSAMNPGERQAITAGHIALAWAVLSWPTWFFLVAPLCASERAGDWVGGGNPIPTLVAVGWLTPSVLAILGGVTVTVIGRRVRTTGAKWGGIAAIMLGTLLFLCGVYALGMMHIQ